MKNDVKNECDLITFEFIHVYLYIYIQKITVSILENVYSFQSIYIIISNKKYILYMYL